MLEDTYTYIHILSFFLSLIFPYVVVFLLFCVVRFLGRVGQCACNASYSPMLNFTPVRRDSVVGIATTYGLDDRGGGVRVRVGSRIFSSPRRQDRLWGPHNLLCNGYMGLFPQGKQARA
jgi:hypothetical protein